MQQVPTEKNSLENYRGVASDEIITEITRVAEQLKGLRIIHVNATPQGGGVAEILKSMIPLMNDIGIEARWYALTPDDSFFRVSKRLHHCLQGYALSPSRADIQLYLEYNKRSADLLSALDVTADLWFFHDAQVLPMMSYMTNQTGVWICHIDTTKPNKFVWQKLFPYMREYRKIVASMPEYLHRDIDINNVAICPPAIDPLQPKHRPLTVARAREVIASLGMDIERHIVCQVSRFDRWKDPWGVVDAYRMVKKEIPGLQLALVGAMTAKDDQDAYEVLDSLKRYAGNDRDIFIFSDPSVIRDLEVNAFQSGADIILRKSTREGFGLTVTEAMWKGRPVIGGNCGGIRSQVCDGVNGYLVDDVRMCADRILDLLRDPALSNRMGKLARESVKTNFLVPRLLRDYLRLSLAALGRQDELFLDSEMIDLPDMTGVNASAH